MHNSAQVGFTHDTQEHRLFAKEHTQKPPQQATLAYNVNINLYRTTFYFWTTKTPTTTRESVFFALNTTYQ